jgi:hypothetical protein
MIIVIQTLHHITFNVKLGFRCLENIFEDIALVFLKLPQYVSLPVFASAPSTKIPLLQQHFSAL